jgi:hypothetical protein
MPSLGFVYQCLNDDGGLLIKQIQEQSRVLYQEARHAHMVPPQSIADLLLLDHHGQRGIGRRGSIRPYRSTLRLAAGA